MAVLEIEARELEFAQCRFCLDDAPVSDLMAPCQCVGTGRFVHAACLRRWQETVVRSGADDRAAICQSCRAPFSLKPPPPPRESLIRIHGNHMREVHPRQPAGPIFDHISTNPYYDSSAVRTLSGSLCRQLLASMLPGCLVLQEPTAQVSLIRRDHWNKGVFLIAGVWRGLGHANSDALIGVNLAGARQPPVRTLDPQLSDLEAYLNGHQVSMSFVTGGPVQPRSTLVLVSVLGRLADVVLPSRVRPVYPVQMDTEDEVLAAGLRCTGALFGEPVDVLEALRRNGLQVVGAIAFQGHAVWSSMQLLAEVARGSWCLARATADDLAVVSPLEDREEVWQAIWSSRNLLRRTPVTPHCEDSATAGCRCVIS